MVPVYNTFEEKSANFNITRIDTIEEFNQLKSVLTKADGDVFRGISQSKYKIYTTLQREKLLEHISGQFSVEAYVNNFRNQPLIRRYFEVIKINLSKISVLSFLQHHRAPTPLVDFTSKLEVALFFAMESLLQENSPSQNEIDNYFSVYHIPADKFKLIDIESVIRDVERYRQRLLESIRDNEKYNELIRTHVDQMTAMDLMEVYLVNLENRYASFSIQNNIRILYQEGIFVHNDFGTEPLEVALKQFFIPATQFAGHAMDDMEGIPGVKERNDKYREDLKRNAEIQKQLEQNIINSYDIHKSLVPEIFGTLSINRDLIYPDFEAISKATFEASK